MRAVVRAQLSQVALATAITAGIRGAEREDAALSHQRRLEIFREADQLTGGSICKNIDALVKDEALLVRKLLGESRTPADIKAARTEIERLVGYIRFARTCKG